jgi:hypothetical protein
MDTPGHFVRAQDLTVEDLLSDKKSDIRFYPDNEKEQNDIFGAPDHLSSNADEEA